jgi:hypothetical protein
MVNTTGLLLPLPPSQKPMYGLENAQTSYGEFATHNIQSLPDGITSASAPNPVARSDLNGLPAAIPHPLIASQIYIYIPRVRHGRMHCSQLQDQEKPSSDVACLPTLVLMLVKAHTLS